MKGVKSYPKAEELLNTIGISIKKETYTKFTKKCILIDPEFGEWSATPATVWKFKSQHPKKAKLKVPQCQKLSDDIVNEKLKHRNIKLKLGTYKGKSYSATFIDPVYGEWTANASNVLQGSEHPERAQKARSLSCNNRTIMSHWKTGKEIIAVGSYELYVLNLLNQEKIDFDWQICFNLSNGKKYFIDLYIKEFDLYVEIKGRAFPDWVEKWKMFQSEYPELKKTICDYDEMLKIGYKR